MNDVLIRLFLICLFIIGILGFAKSHAAPVIVYQDHPILNDQTITVDTYYDDMNFDGYHTTVYSSRQPYLLFMHEVNINSIDIVHTWAKCWITQKVNEQMLANCQSNLQRTSTSSTNTSVVSNLGLYSISEDECEEDE